MCGRTACTLAPDQICKASSIRNKATSGPKYIPPQWKDHPGKEHSYSPSYNIAPSRFTPVLLREDALSGAKRDADGNFKTNYIVQPMMWGFIPHFFKGPTVKDFNYKTNNCRIEDIEEKKIFLPSLKRGQRCIILCDGFYEWESTKSDKNKQPYFIFAPQPEGMEIWNKESWEPKELWTEEEGWNGPNLLKMAGLFSSWTSPEGEEIYSYTVITMESSDAFPLHHRVPAILDTEEKIENWLNHGEVDYKTALSSLSRDPKIKWHAVSSLVNNSRNQEESLNKPVNLEKKKESGSSKLMAAWLKKGSQKSDMKSNGSGSETKE